ncbi:retrovirus-related pol polyprotein from transposon TNT 1-94 [Tanacetum coccineum]|uniref:Retrovirus-related pol polyprotein from transposon TNT 1-94 n=1 Tax=Tanacetum coccineum TaxID=301880 RepID=A0ABQ5DP81_9ASTR
MGTFRETLTEGTEGALNLGLPKDIYSLINHYTDAKDIWDNVNMLLEGSELTKEDRESQLYDDFEHFCQNKGETIYDYYVTFITAVKLNRGLKDSNYDQLYAYLKQHEAHANENKMMLDRFTQHTMDPLALMSNVSHQTSSNTRNQATVQDGRVVVQNVQGRQNRGQGNNARGRGAAGYGGAQNRVGNANPGQARQIKYYNCNGIGHIARNCTQKSKLPQELQILLKDKIVAKDNTLLMKNVDEATLFEDLATQLDNCFTADDL